MERYSEVIGLPVICADSGKKTGTVKDVIFKPRTRKVKAFLLENKGYEFGRKILLLNDVLNLGRDALVVSESSCIKLLGKTEYSKSYDGSFKMMGLRIYTKAGDDLGVVKDILFDYKTGTVEGVEVSDGLFRDIIVGRNILPLFGKVEFGEDNILVDREAVDEMMNTGGGIKKKLLGE